MRSEYNTPATGHHAIIRPPQTVVAVSSDSRRDELLDALSVDKNDYDVFFMESFDGGYSRIKQLTPDLIVMFMEMDDVAGCQLLSMLALDKQLACIPVVTCPARRRRQELEDFMAEVNRDLSRRPHVIEMN